MPSSISDKAARWFDGLESPPPYHKQQIDQSIRKIYFQKNRELSGELVLGQCHRVEC
jgi:hypothetical protein